MSLRVVSPFVAIYVCGLIAAQIHRQGLGITEIATLDTYYLLTGAAFILCLSPALLFIAATELSLASRSAVAELRAAARDDDRARRAYQRRIVSMVLLYVACCLAVLWLFVQRPDNTYFDFRLYRFPKYYVYWNIAGLNLGLALIWLTFVILVRFQESDHLPSDRLFTWRRCPQARVPRNRAKQASTNRTPAVR